MKNDSVVEELIHPHHLMSLLLPLVVVVVGPDGGRLVEVMGLFVSHQGHLSICP